MSFAFGHLIAAWIGGKLYEKLKKVRISHNTWFFLLIGGILPDIDFLFDWTLAIDTHRSFTHSLLFIISVSLLVYIIFSLIKKYKHTAKNFALAIGAGIFIHLLLDTVFYSGLNFFWPLGAKFYLFKTNLNIWNFVVLDMALGTAWIFYFWLTKRIKF